MIQRTLLLSVLAGLLGGCATQTYEAKPMVPEQAATSYFSRSLDNPDLLSYMQTQGYPQDLLPIKAWGLRELTLAALYYHPQLDVARAQWKAAQAAEISAGQKPNPGISVKGEHHSKTDGGVSPWTLGLGFDIPIETGGKRAARMERAASLSEAARIDIGHTAWLVRSRLRNSLTDYGNALRQADLLQREVAIRAEIVQMLQNRMDAGMVSDIDLSNARLQWQKSQQALTAEQGRLPQLKAALATAVGLSLQALDSVKLDTTISIPADLPGETLQRTTLLNRLDIRAALARYAASEARLRLEIAKQRPDITLSPGYSFDQGDNRWSLGLSLILALLNKNEGPIAEAQAQRELEAHQFVEMQSRTIGELEQSHARYRATQQEIVKAEQLLDLQKKRAAQSEHQFDVGYADRLELATTRMETLSAEQSLQTAQVRAQLAAGALEDAMQRPLDDIELPTPQGTLK